MADIQYGPILKWPGKLRSPGERIRAPFKSSHTGTIELLEREMRLVSAEAVIVQIALADDQFTRDGLPKYQARAEHPGVIVAFRKPVRNGVGQVMKIPLSFPADRFLTWESNLRAVAIALEDLRRIDRYGVTQNSEQYTGFKALPGPGGPGGPQHDSIPTVEDAARFIASAAAPLIEHITDWALRSEARAAGTSAILRDPRVSTMLYRLCAKSMHPDAGGSAVDWAKLQAAKTLLDDLHGAHVSMRIGGEVASS